MLTPRHLAQKKENVAGFVGLFPIEGRRGSRFDQFRAFLLIAANSTVHIQQG